MDAPEIVLDEFIARMKSWEKRAWKFRKVMHKKGEETKELMDELKQIAVKFCQYQYMDRIRLTHLGEPSVYEYMQISKTEILDKDNVFIYTSSTNPNYDFKHRFHLVKENNEWKLVDELCAVFDDEIIPCNL